MDRAECVRYVKLKTNAYFTDFVIMQIIDQLLGHYDYNNIAISIPDIVKVISPFGYTKCVTFEGFCRLCHKYYTTNTSKDLKGYNNIRILRILAIKGKIYDKRSH